MISMRMGVKHALAVALRASGALRLAAARRRVLILSFHRVVADFPAERARSLPPLLIGAETLRRLLLELARRWDVVPLPIAAREAAGPPRRGPRVAAVTFDDGYRDVYEVGLPVLARLGMPAAVYLPTDFVSGAGPLLHDRLYALLAALREQRLELGAGLPERPAATLAAAAASAGSAPHPLTDRLCATLSRAALQELVEALTARVGPVAPSGAPLTWAMARELAHRGWEIGAHTVRHTLLPPEPAEVMARELVSSKLEIEAHTGRPCRHFAYPNGAWSPAARRAVREAGFESAVTTEDRPLRVEGEDPLLLPRKGLWEQACLGADGKFSAAVAVCNLAGAFAWLGLARPGKGTFSFLPISERCTSQKGECPLFGSGIGLP